MKSSKNLFLSAAIAALIATPLVAKADTFLFNQNGTGAMGAISADLIDQAPGNALASGALTNVGTTAVPVFTTVAGTRFTLYYQANLSVLKNGTAVVFANGFNTPNFFTFTSGFGELITSASPPGADGKTSANFAFDASNPVNFFRIYATTAAASDLNGTGFSTGKLIFEGKVISEPASNFSANVSAGATQPLDQFLANDYPGITSGTGSGASTINVLTTFFNPGYFPSLSDNSIISSNFNTSTVTPFVQVDPSKCFASRTTDCAVSYNIGTVNGTGGPDFLLLADANQTLSQVTKVPEPATTAILGLGLAVMGLFGVSRKKQS